MAGDIERFSPRVASWLCLLAACAVLPFTIYHALVGHVYMALISLGPGLTPALLWLYLQRGGEVPQYLILVGALVGNIAGVFAIARLELLGIFWLYPLVIFNFGIAGPRIGGAFNLLLVGTIFAMSYSWAPPAMMTRIVATASLSLMLAFIFSWNMSRQRTQLELLAAFDPLTNAGNRREMERALSQSVAETRRYNRDLALIVLDIDHFKQINDNYGHQVGDRVLKRFAELVRVRLRAADRFFRHGGEEFLVLTPETDAKAAAELAEAIRELVESHEFVEGLHITVSAGVAALASDESAENMLRRGDAALYQAKAAGRNRCVTA